jgi:predicted transcriptional regulator
MNNYKLFDAEYKFMSIIWESSPINSTKLHKICLEKLGWKKSTTYTMIRKLCEKGLIRNENATVTALVNKDEVKKYESQQLVDRVFDSSLPNFISAFLKDKKLTEKEANEIRKMIEEATK